MNALLGKLTGVGSHLGIFTQYAIWFALAALTIALVLTAWRLFRGPAIEDRILALDAMYVQCIIFIVLLGIFFNSSVLFEAALITAMLGFISTVALAQFLSRAPMGDRE